MRSLKVLVIGTILLAILGVGLMIADRRSDTAAAREVPLSHVHGLGRNPADGALIVATHTGSFRLPEGSSKLTRIGRSYQDTMGFTVAGPNHFLGSGHPDVPSRVNGQPALLGLIESTDSGQSWRSVSLSGEADFHGLAVAHGRLYGWDATSGLFMVSDDRVAWDVRSTVDLQTFAVDPASPDHVIGAAPSGLIESVDGGRTWRTLDGPALITMSWRTDDGLWGGDAAGSIWRRSETNAWQPVGQTLGMPQVLLADGTELFLAAHDDDQNTSILQSSDGGRTWHVRYQAPGR